MKKAKIILIAASAAMLLTGCMSREETEALMAREARRVRTARLEELE